MEGSRQFLNLKFTAESAQLEKVFLLKHRYNTTKERLDNISHGSERGNIKWVASKVFSIEVGQKQIREYIQTWKMHSRWIYSLDFLYSTEEEHHTFYHYRARFSTPTPQRPVQGTASVYFVVGLPKVTPETLPVEVMFVVESNKLVHTPGKSVLIEKWLTDVIESKTLLRSSLDF